MRLFITGGAGFIGAATVRLAIARGHDILIFDKLTYAANLAALESVSNSPKYRLRRGDICDSAALESALTSYQPDAILHLAAESHVDRSIDGPSEFISTNIVGTYTLLEAAHAYWVSREPEGRERFRLVHVSTDEVFGSLEDSDDRFTEISPYRPRSPYSASKAASDHLARAWQETYGLPVIVTNCSNNYGPFQFPEKLIPVVILRALAGRTIPVYGTGENIRDWLFVDDHARALLDVTERGSAGETYNIGGNSECRNIDLVMICRELDCHRPSGAPHERLISFVTDRPGHDHRYAIDPTKISGELDWSPSVSLDEGIRRTVDWFLANQSWWLDVQERGCSLERIGLKMSRLA